MPPPPPPFAPSIPSHTSLRLSARVRRPLGDAATVLGLATLVALCAAGCSAGTITVNPTTGLVTTEEGGTAAFTVTLDTMPTADVTVKVSSGDETEGRVHETDSSIDLVFTSADFAAKTVTVTGQDDMVDDGDRSYSVQLGNAVSADLGYNALVVQDVSLTNTDNDTAAFVDVLSSLVTSEDGSKKPTFSLRLATEPVDTVTVTIGVSDPLEGGYFPETTMVFDASNYNVTQQRTVLGKDDSTVDGTKPFNLLVGAASNDAKYDKRQLVFNMQNEDDDVPGFIFFPPAGRQLSTTEAGGTATLRVKLTSSPTDVVTILVRSQNEAEGKVDVAQVQFHPSEWQDFKLITVTGQDDNVDDGDLAFIVEFYQTQSNDPLYDNKVGDSYSIINKDDDTSGIALKKGFRDPLVTYEDKDLDGQGAPFYVQLDSEPTADVTIVFTSSAFAEVGVYYTGRAPAKDAQIVIEPANWQRNNTLWAKGFDEKIDDGDFNAEISVAVSGGDPKYTALMLPTMPVTNVDDDVTGFEVCDSTVPPCTFNALGGETTEKGATDVYYIRLLSEPTNTVVLDVASSNTSEVSVSPTSVTWGATTWEGFRAITVTGVPDNADDGDKTEIITMTVTTADPKYRTAAMTQVPNWFVKNFDTDLDECADGMHCSHDCNDPNIDHMSLLDFTCACKPPTEGATTTGVDAVCTLDECEGIPVNKATCVNAKQECVDPDKALDKVDDWMCKCVAPSRGSDRVRSPATCLLDECVAHSSVCGIFQQCFDPNKEFTNLDNWKCRCTKGTGEAVTASATCAQDECVDLNKKAVCEAGGNQVCTDPTTVVSATSDNDWYCNCTWPYVGMVTAAAVDCQLDECNLQANADLCASRPFQACRDEDHATLDTWECICVTPATGAPALRAPATCIIDECLSGVNKSICLAAVSVSRGGQGNGIGHGYSQICIDPNTDAASTGDWVCVCQLPSQGGNTSAAAADCFVDECTIEANQQVCLNNNQSCVDPNTANHDLSSEGDWYCDCTFPSVGPRTPMKATDCWLNECEVNGLVCTGAGQTCFETSNVSTILDDWYCNCTGPTEGIQKGGPATCVYDECKFEGRVCGTSAQECFEPNNSTASRGDWECRCRTPFNGTAQEKLATCFYDECAFAPCGDAARQVCIDRDQNTTSKADFICECRFPLKGATRTGGITTCFTDECLDAAKNSTCGFSQTCWDQSAADDDYTCECTWPYLGARGRPATCTYDECSSVTVCQDNNQDCRDTDVTTNGTWACQCRAPLKGAEGVMTMAACGYDECTDARNAQVCTQAMQDCTDPSNTTSSDWLCKCRSPVVGEAVGTPANCATDLCALPANSCGADQDCVQTGLQWKCVCRAPAAGEAFGARATCVVSDCGQAERDQCAAFKQECKVNGAEWSCVCVPPASGTAPGGRATCVYDECVGNAVCTAVDQDCVDPNTSEASLNNWQCQCRTPASGVPGVRNAADCKLDECAGNTDCGAGQVCFDPTDGVAQTEDWVCRCSAPFNGTNTTNPVASCVHRGECGDPAIRAVCENAQQDCRDENAGTQGDWQCVCRSPGEGIATKGAATCSGPIGASNKTPTDSDDDSFPWFWVILPVALLLIIAAMLAFVCRSKGEGKNPPQHASPASSPRSPVYNPLHDDVCPLCLNDTHTHTHPYTQTPFKQNDYDAFFPPQEAAAPPPAPYAHVPRAQLPPQHPQTNLLPRSAGAGRGGGGPGLGTKSSGIPIEEMPDDFKSFAPASESMHRCLLALSCCRCLHHTHYPTQAASAGSCSASQLCIDPSLHRLSAQPLLFTRCQVPPKGHARPAASQFSFFLCSVSVAHSSSLRLLLLPYSSDDVSCRS